MKDNKHGPRAFCLSLLAALGLTVFFSSAAQAGNGSFTVDLAPATNQAIVGEQEGLSTFSVPVRNIEITCHAGVLIEAQFFNATEVLGTLKFEECLVEELIGSGAPPRCEIANERTFTMKFIALATLYGTALFVLFEPDVEKPLESAALLVSIPFKHSVECLVSGIPLRGQVATLALSEPGVSGLEASQFLLDFSETWQLFAGDVLRYGTALAYIDASIAIEVPGATKFGIH